MNSPSQIEETIIAFGDHVVAVSIPYAEGSVARNSWVKGYIDAVFLNPEFLPEVKTPYVEGLSVGKEFMDNYSLDNLHL